MNKEKYILSNVPIFDGTAFLGFLEVPLQDIVDGKYEPLTEKELKNFMPALAALYKVKEDK